MPVEAEPKLKTIGDTDVTLGMLRKRCWSSMTPKVAADAGLSLEAADRFLKMSYVPDQATCVSLARRLGLL